MFICFIPHEAGRRAAAGKGGSSWLLVVENKGYLTWKGGGTVVRDKGSRVGDDSKAGGKGAGADSGKRTPTLSISAPWTARLSRGFRGTFETLKT